LSKYVRDLLDEFNTEQNIQDDFNLHVLKVTIDDRGEIEQVGNALPVFNIEIDAENKEVLLHYLASTTQSVSVAAAKELLTDELLDYEICAAQEKDTTEALIRLDTPLLGFGENPEQKCFFNVCLA